jgi:hypothetical protein
MKRTPLLFALLTLAGIALNTTRAASGASVAYTLNDQSRFEYGCFGPCACPVLSSGPVSGTFALTRTTIDPPFVHYALTGAQWHVVLGGKPVTIVGSGENKVGGEFAVQHQLTLDLTVDSNPPQHFDSGVVSGGGDFPAVNIDIAVHGFFCLDTVIVLRSQPATAGTGGGGDGVAFAIGPNPSSGPTEFSFALAESGPVELRVFDVRGCAVRTIANGSPMSAGPQLIAWDGRRDDGRRVPGGLYLVRLRLPGGEAMRRLVVIR